MTPPKLTLYVILVLVFFCRSGTTSSPEGPVVDTTLGKIRGVKADDGDYYMFMGIPYARVNSTNPFGRAIPQEPFNGVFDAIDDTTICPQLEEFNRTIVGSLDCLHINIYVPTTASASNPKAVMLMIFGGAFIRGFAGRYLYGPKYLLRHDVILVTFNYRLGPYGFMCLDIPEVPGNEGLKDQLLALRWINKNIEAFGGDRNRITAYGNSAGGVSVDYHLAAQHEKLFTQAILQSGTALAVSIYRPPNRKAPFQLASYLGYETDNIYEALSFLATVDELKIVNVTIELGLTFTVCVEKQFNGVEGFLLENWVPIPIPKVNKMPFLLGITEDEMADASISPPDFFRNELIPTILNDVFDVNKPGFEEMVDLIHKFYLGDADITPDRQFEAIDFMSDITFNHQMFRCIKKYLENGSGDIYFYFFSHVGARNYIRLKDNVTVGGAVHADELGYLYDVSFFDTPNHKDQLVIDRMTEAWANFAKFGHPLPESSELLPAIWKPIRRGTPYHYLELNAEPEVTVGTRPFHERMAFWDLFFKTNADFQMIPSSD